MIALLGEIVLDQLKFLLFLEGIVFTPGGAVGTSTSTTLRSAFYAHRLNVVEVLDFNAGHVMDEHCIVSE